MKLFERKHQKTKLTEAGKIYAEHFKTCNQNFNYAKELATKINSSKKNRLIIGYCYGWSLTDFFPEIIERMQERCPNTELMLRGFAFDKFITPLLNHEIDVALVISLDQIPIPTLKLKKLTSLNRIFLYSKYCKTAKKETENLNLSDFKDETFLIPIPNISSPKKELVCSFCSPYGFMPKIEPLPSIDSILTNTSLGLGVSIVDEWTAFMNQKRYGLNSIDLGFPLEIASMWDSSNDNSALSIFLDELHAVFDRR